MESYYALANSRDGSKLGCGTSRFLLSTTDITALDHWSTKMQKEGIIRQTETRFTFDKKFAEWVEWIHGLREYVKRTRRISHTLAKQPLAEFRKVSRVVRTFDELEKGVLFEELEDKDFEVQLWHSDGDCAIPRFKIVAPTEKVLDDWFETQQMCKAGVFKKTSGIYVYDERKLDILMSDENFPELERFRSIVTFAPV